MKLGVFTGDDRGMSIMEARAKASAQNDRLNDGEMPESPRQQLRRENQAQAAAPTVADLWGSYSSHHLANKKPRTVDEFTRLYKLHIATWAERLGKPAAEIALGDVEAFKVKIGAEHGQYTANRCLAILSSMYRKRGHAFGLPRNWTPTAGVDPFPESARDRVLTVEELSAILAAIDADENPTIRDYFRMLLYTGMRKTSVAGMRWDDLNIHGATWKLPGEITKNGKPLVVHLIPEALAIIKRRYDDNPADNPFVFPACRITPAQVEKTRTLRAEGQTTRAIAEATGIAQTSIMRVLKPEYVPSPVSCFDGAGAAWTRIKKRAGIVQRTTIHDLRRTFCTTLIEKGVSLPIVAAAMGHRSMETTARHYAIASDKAVAVATATGIGALLAEVAKAGKAKRKSQGAA
jgi:integrase